MIIPMFSLRQMIRASLPAVMMSGVLAPAITITAISIATTAQASGTAIVAHRAFYEMSLGERAKNAAIVNVNGKSGFVMERDCDGWRSTEDYALVFVSEDGSSERVLSHFESWEADSGDLYSFDISESSTFLGKKDFGGFASITDQGSGIAAFSVAPDAEITLPEDIYFPVKHLKSILSSAEAGKTIFAATVFTGADPDDALMKTSTVVGKWQDVAKGDDDEFGKLVEEGYWPVQIAYFRPSSQTSEPEYEINFSMQRNGIVRGYEIDYGDFSIQANLARLEGVDGPVCS